MAIPSTGSSSRTIVLGPSFELHSGVHGALLDTPPPGVRYIQLPCSYRCLFPRNTAFPANPFDDLSAADGTAYTLPSSEVVVHSARLPVANDVPWVADNDCFLSTLQFGPFWAYGSDGHVRSGDVDWPAIRLRQRIMLSRFLDDRCEGILFWTEYSRTSALRHIQHLALLEAREMADLWAKSDVVYPALPLRASANLEAEPVSVISTGRTFDDKGGATALATFATLQERYGGRIRLVFVGDLPTGQPRPPGILFLPVLSREDFLGLLRSCHIFFSPTLYESLGMTFIEAACAGLAIVTSCGPGMEHIQEILVDGVNAFLISNSLAPQRKIERYVAAIAKLVEDPSRRREMSSRNRRLVETGVVSIAQRDRRLLGHYERMWRNRKREGGGSGLGGRKLEEQRRLVEKTFSEAYIWLEMAARRGSRNRRVLLPGAPGEVD